MAATSCSRASPPEHLGAARGGVPLGCRELGTKGDDLAVAGEERGEHIARRVDLVRLPVVPDGRALLDDRTPEVGLDLTRDDAKQRRLACAVRSHERRTLAEGQREGHVLEEHIARVPEAHVGDLKDGHAAGVLLA
jgi:hypothetical protein